MISEKDYNSKQLNDLDSLWSEIVNAVEKINKEKKDSIKKILIQVIDNNGKDIPY